MSISKGSNNTNNCDLTGPNQILWQIMCLMSNACFAGMLGPTFLMAYLDFQGELGIKYCFGYFGFCCKHLLYTFGFAVFVSCPYFCLIIPFREIILVVKKKESSRWGLMSLFCLMSSFILWCSLCQWKFSAMHIYTQFSKMKLY